MSNIEKRIEEIEKKLGLSGGNVYIKIPAECSITGEEIWKDSSGVIDKPKLTELDKILVDDIRSEISEGAEDQ
jgi:hypothetical protein